MPTLLCAVCKLVGDRDRMLAMFSFTSGPTADVISEFAATFQLPVVSAAPAVDESLRRRLTRRHRRPTDARDDAATLHHRRDDESFAFFVRPLYSTAVIDVIQHYKWQHVFYVFDDDDGSAVLIFVSLSLLPTLIRASGHSVHLFSTFVLAIWYFW